jgi:hypothetical protein
MAVGGDILEVTYNHPTIGNGSLYPKAGEDSTYDLGGFRSADEDQGVDGGGNMIDTLTRRRWSFEVTVSNDMNDRKELEKIAAMAASPVAADWTFSHINGTVYGGKGKPVGDMQLAGQGSTFTLKVAGGGQLKAI